MAIPSRVLGSGVNSLSTVSICGDGNASVSAAGTSAGNATAITFVYNNITTVASGAGVKLPPTEMGELIWITNSGANALTVYPYEAASTINGASSAAQRRFLPLATARGKNCKGLTARFRSCTTVRFQAQHFRPLHQSIPLMQ
jgi:hypothetical protein